MPGMTAGSVVCGPGYRKAPKAFKVFMCLRYEISDGGRVSAAVKKRILAAALAALLLTGCSSAAEEAQNAFVPGDDKRLVIYTPHKGEVSEPVIKEFEQRTGIWVELETGGTAALLERIAAGDTDCDLMLGGGVDSLSAYSDCFSPYFSVYNNDILPAYSCPDGSYSPFSALPVVLIYNTRLVHRNPPAGWASLLDRSWTGRIAFADPNVSGSSYTSLCTMLQALGGDNEQVLTSFEENLGGKVLPDSGDVVGAVAEGRCYIGVTLEETALKAIDAGYDIAVVYPEEGTSALPDGAAIVAGCRHRENAELFIDFLLCPDMQRMLQDSLFRRSVCTPYGEDTGAEKIRLIDYDIDWAGGAQARLLELWNDAAGGTEQ